jgi:NTE family protein
MPTADLVLEGGGVKGVGLAGAVETLLRAGYSFSRVAGTSAGSLLAAFVAAGIGADELVAVMDRFDYAKVPDRATPGIPVVSEGLSLLHSAGAYEGDYLRDFMFEELGKLGVTTFGDLRRHDPGGDTLLPPERQYNLVVMATDITNGRLLRLPWDYHLLHLDPDDQVVADAVRASASIPLYFEPVIVKDGHSGEQTTLVDGGILSNFAIEIFNRNDGVPPRWPTFGVQILPDLPAGSAQLLPRSVLPALRVSQLIPPLRLLEQVVATAIVGNDQTHLEQPCVRRRLIQVDTSPIGIIDFDAPAATRQLVIANGARAAEAFLESWDWERYRLECLGASDPVAIT